MRPRIASAGSSIPEIDRKSVRVSPPESSDQSPVNRIVRQATRFEFSESDDEDDVRLDFPACDLDSDSTPSSCSDAPQLCRQASPPQSQSTWIARPISESENP